MSFWCLKASTQWRRKATREVFIESSQVGAALTLEKSTVCPHAAFEHPDTPTNARRRESIECLVYIFYPERRTKANEHDIDVSMSIWSPSHGLTD